MLSTGQINGRKNRRFFSGLVTHVHNLHIAHTIGRTNKKTVRTVLCLNCINNRGKKFSLSLLSTHFHSDKFHFVCRLVRSSVAAVLASASNLLFTRNPANPMDFHTSGGFGPRLHMFVRITGATLCVRACVCCCCCCCWPRCLSPFLCRVYRRLIVPGHHLFTRFSARSVIHARGSHTQLQPYLPYAIPQR